MACTGQPCLNASLAHHPAPLSPSALTDEDPLPNAGSPLTRRFLKSTVPFLGPIPPAACQHPCWGLHILTSPSALQPISYAHRCPLAHRCSFSQFLGRADPVRKAGPWPSSKESPPTRGRCPRPSVRPAVAPKQSSRAREGGSRTSCSSELYSPSVCSRMITRSRLLWRVL